MPSAFVSSVDDQTVLALLQVRKEAGETSVSFRALEKQLKPDFPGISAGVFQTDLEFTLRRLKRNEWIDFHDKASLDDWQVRLLEKTPAPV